MDRLKQFLVSVQPTRSDTTLFRKVSLRYGFFPLLDRVLSLDSRFVQMLLERLARGEDFFGARGMLAAWGDHITGFDVWITGINGNRWRKS